MYAASTGSWWYVVNSIVLSTFVGFALVVLLNLVPLGMYEEFTVELPKFYRLGECVAGLFVKV